MLPVLMKLECTRPEVHVAAEGIFGLLRSFASSLKYHMSKHHSEEAGLPSQIFPIEMHIMRNIPKVIL